MRLNFVVSVELKWYYKIVQTMQMKQMFEYLACKTGGYMLLHREKMRLPMDIKETKSTVNH